MSYVTNMEMTSRVDNIHDMTKIRRVDKISRCNIIVIVVSNMSA